MKLVTALLLLLAVRSDTADAADTCAVFKEDGECYDPKMFYVTGHAVNGTRTIIEAGRDPTAASIYDQFIEPLVDISAEVALHDLQRGAFCFGAFEGGRLRDYDEMDGLGCHDLPMKAATKYGTVAGQMAIPPFLQQVLVPLSLWSSATEDTVTPSFCMALRVPTDTCGELTFGASLNKEAVATLNEVLPSGGAGETLLALISALQKDGVDPVTVAISFGEGLDVPVKFFTNRKFVKEDFHAHLYFSARGPIELPFIDEKENAKTIIQIEGGYQRGFHMGKSTAAVELALTTLLDPSKISRAWEKRVILNHVESIVGEHPEVITTTGNLTVDLNGVTGGLFGSFVVSGASIRALKIKKKVRKVHPGFYMHANVPMNVLKEIAGSVCDKFEGAILAVADTGCPALENNNTEGVLGLEIRAELLELVIEWPAFFLRCKVHDMEKETPRMNCQVNDIVFGINEDENGYNIGKSHALTGEIEELVSVVSKDAVKEAEGFKKKIVVTSKLSSQVAPKAFKPVAMFFGGQSGDLRASVDFGFVPNYKCKSAHRLWSSRDKSTYKHHFSQAGYDDTRASCFLSCYEWHEANPTAGNVTHNDLCCSFESLHDTNDGNECRVGSHGADGASDNRKSATNTFVEDFEKLQDLPIVGSRCEKAKDCVSGYCHTGVCKHECAPDNQCFPSQWSKCFGSDDACLDINGFRHYCEESTDSCACDDSSGHCTRRPHKVTTLGLTEVTKDDKTSEKATKDNKTSENEVQAMNSTA